MCQASLVELVHEKGVESSATGRIVEPELFDKRNNGFQLCISMLDTEYAQHDDFLQSA